MHQAIAAYVDEYEMDSDGGAYAPSPHERALIDDAVAGLLCDADFVQAWGAWHAELQATALRAATEETPLRQALGETLTSTLSEMCDDGTAPDWFDARNVDVVLDAITPVLSAHDGAAPCQAARDVLAERHRQVTAEGWTSEHDDEHTLGELGLAAALYALPYGATLKDGDPLIRQADHIQLHMTLELTCGWKLNPEPDPRRRLVKSGALIVAEIDRLDRAARRSQHKDSE